MGAGNQGQGDKTSVNETLVAMFAVAVLTSAAAALAQSTADSKDDQSSTRPQSSPEVA